MDVASLTDHELREALKQYEQAPGPITNTTRTLYRNKLAALIAENEGDTSDEDYNVQDEEEDDDDEEEDEEIDFEEEADLIDDLDDNIKLSSTTEASNLTTSAIADASPNRISRGILIFLVSFFVTIFSLYLYSKNDYKLFVPSQPFKNITKQLLVLLALSPIGYVAYRTVRFYLRRRHQDMKRVCGLVNEALELLQSPDNPKGLMPILHIRDTLLTPAERKTKKMINLWSKAVKFIEEHESRVKVELVNIDGEDFRAWKWIGSRKL